MTMGRSGMGARAAVALSLAVLAIATGGRADSQRRMRSDAPADKPAHYAYLFAHMMKQDYGRLYYSISRDGLHWRVLNGGKRVHKEYRGHPDICTGHDGRFYLLGNYERRPEITIWASSDLVTWSKHIEFRPDIYKTPNFKPAMRYHGAPKMLYDKPSGRYVITWHSTCRKADPKKPEHFWSGMRTLYVTSRSLKEFTAPKRLFAFEMATIDVLLRPEGGRYYAIIKDERYPSFDWPTGKTLRISSAETALGPYGKPSAPVTPNFREAPMLIPRGDGRGWYLYYEQYPGVSYGLSTAASLAGPWHGVYWQKYRVPAAARHGCMIPITQTQHDAIVAAYGGGATK